MTHTTTISTDATMKIHPVCNVLPKMTADDFARLEADIKANGVREPGKVYQGFLVDGYHRYMICEKHGIEFPTVELVLPPGASLVEHCVAINLNRRHLTQSQKAAVATDMLPLLEQEAAARQKAGKPTCGPTGPDLQTGGVKRSRKAAADAVGVGDRTVGRAKRVAEASPELAEKVKAGEITLHAAEKQVAAKAKAEAKPEPEAEYPADGWFADVCRRLHSIKREIVEKADTPIGRRLHGQSATTDIQNIVSMIRNAEPAAKCPYCRKDGSGLVKGCKACKGTHWISVGELKAVPKEMLA